MMRYLSLVLLATRASSVYPQTWEESNDPNNLCSDSYSGYKATLDCRGYVYCNEGYLMGGDVIPCWPNQLFDEVNAVCTTWQSVTESLGDDISWKCPEYDASLMVPDDKDENANPQLFFVSTYIDEECGISSNKICSHTSYTLDNSAEHLPSMQKVYVNLVQEAFELNALTHHTIVTLESLAAQSIPIHHPHPQLFR